MAKPVTHRKGGARSQPIDIGTKTKESEKTTG